MSNSLMTGSVAHVLDAIGGTPIVKLQKMAEHVPRGYLCQARVHEPEAALKTGSGSISSTEQTLLQLFDPRQVGPSSRRPAATRAWG